MWPFGYIKDVPDSCDENFRFFIVGSSCVICPLSKMVLNLSVAAPTAELWSMTDQPTNQRQVKIELLRLSELELGLS